MKQSQPAKSRPTEPARRFQCPTCKRFFARSASDQSKGQGPFPFCSERCKLVDLGAWLDAEYRIPSRPDEESEEALTDPFDDPEVTP